MPDRRARLHSLHAITLSLILGSPLAQGQQEVPEHAARQQLTIHAGIDGLGHSVEDFGRIGADYRFREVSRWRLRPTIGIFGTENDASYIHAGVRRDLYLTRQWAVTLGVDLGAFHDGHDFRLGNELELQSSLELSYVHESSERLGIGVSHISNGSVSDDNPGTNAILLLLSVPL